METFNILIEAKPFCVFNNGPMEQLKSKGFNIVNMRGSGIDNPDFLEALKSANAVICGNELHVDDELLKIGSNLEIIAKIGTGLDSIDLAAATRNKVVVCNTPGKNKQAVADHVFALILGVARKIIQCDQSLREGRWEHTQILCHEIWRKTIGILGLGSIGQNVALRAKGFQMRVIAHDPFWPDAFAEEQEIESVSIEQLFEISDIVTIHAPLQPETTGLIDKSYLSMMKPTALLVNTARGAIVKESDLYEILKNRDIAGAGIDVFENEPPTDSPLLELDNVVLSPHTASFTYDSIHEMNSAATDQLIEFYNGIQPRYTVNKEAYDCIKVLRVQPGKKAVTV